MTQGVLRVYLGVAPGAGATFRMLDEGQRRRGRGADVVVVIDEVDRPGLGDRLAGLERLGTAVPTRVAEADVDAVLARRPDVLLFDGLDRMIRPDPGRAGATPLELILATGIDVVTTMSAHRLGSFRDLQLAVTGRPDPDEVPDEVLRRADQIELVDITPDALRRRMAHGNVLAADAVDATVAEFFRPAHLSALRERTLIWVVDDIRRRRHEDTTGTGAPTERVGIGLTGAASGLHVVERGIELARRADAEIIGVHVRPVDGFVTRSGPHLDAQRRSVLAAGGSYRELVGDSVAETLASFAERESLRHLVVGARRESGRDAAGSVAEALVRLASTADVHVVAADPATPAERRSFAGLPRAFASVPAGRRTGTWVGGAIGLALLTTLLAELRPHVSLTTAALLYLSLVLVVAAAGGLLPGLAASLTAFVLLNWYFTPPFRSLHIDEPENLVTLIVFVTVALVVSALVDRSARRSIEARRARAEASALASTSAALVGSNAPLPELLAQIRSTFALDSATVLERGPHGWETICAVGDDPPVRPEDGSARPLDRTGQVMLVLGAATLSPDDHLVLNAFVDQLATAREASRLRAETERLEAVERTNALRSALLQAVSHDLRTPLAAIKASASGLLRADVELTPGDRNRLIVNIDRSTDRLDRVVGNLLDMSRIQAGCLDLTTRPSALEDVVAAALAALDHSVTVRVDVPESLPLVLVDPELLERALANVVSNALAWAPADRPVRIEAAEVAGRIDLRVVDQGPGIPPHARARVFEPFQRFGDRSTDAGVGLGLAIARGFTTAMGGRLTLDDTPGGGLTVTFGLTPVGTGA